LSPNATLTFSTNLTVSQNISITINASLLWNASTLSADTINNNGALIIQTLDPKVLQNTTVNNYGTMAVNASGVINLSGTTTINNDVSGTINIDSNGGMVEQSGSLATVNNEGLIKKMPSESGGAFYMIFDMNNAGVIDVGQNQTFLFLTIGQNFSNLDDGILQGYGSFDITSNFSNTGSVSPGEENMVGSLEIVNDFSLSDSAKLLIDIHGASAGDYDFVSVFGAPDLNGSITINLNYEAAIGETFTILSAALGINSCNFPSQISTSFNDLNYTFNVICSGNTLQLEVANVTLNTNTFNEDTFRFFATPNPINRMSKFVIPDNLNTVETSISVYNYLGQQLSKHALSETSAYSFINLKSGLYFAQLKQNNRILATTRFIVP